MTAPGDADQRKRLRWRCRRGTRELDMLLAPLAEGALARLSDADLPALARLLDSSDPELYAWLSGAEPHPEPAQAALIDRLRPLLAVSAHAAP